MTAPREQIRAENAAEAFWSLDPFEAVRPGDPWYADIEARFDPTKYGFIAQLVNRLTPVRGRPPYVHLGVVGHRGTGKTTLVRSAMERLAPTGIHPVYVDALNSLDQADFSFADFLLVVARSVVESLENAGAGIPKAEAELVQLWFAEVLLSEEHRKELLGSVEGSAEAKAGIPFLAKLMAKVTAVFKSENVYRQEIRRRAERDPADLLRRANALLDAASKSLGRSIVIVADNLEKINNRALVDAAILRRADDVRGLRAHVILFLHPADQYAPITVQAGQAFTLLTLPMLPVRERDDGYEKVAPAVVATCAELLDKRVNLHAVFESPAECVERIVLHSGGRLRDVLQLARNASELTRGGKVTLDLIDRAARRIKGERSPALRPGDRERLAVISRHKEIENQGQDAYLLLHSFVLHYNGESWWDIHPLVRLDEDFQRLDAQIRTS